VSDVVNVRFSESGGLRHGFNPAGYGQERSLGHRSRLSGNRTFQPAVFAWVIEVPRNIYVLLYVLALVAVVVSVDVLFFKHRFWERLLVNVGIVLVFAAFYLRFLKNP
jgi:uncharacterized membrane protein